MGWIRVLIIDEHDAVRQALEARLGSVEGVEVVGCTGCWQEGVLLAVEKVPDVVILETKRSDGQGMAALRRLKAECPGVQTIVLTSYPDPEERRQALEAGAARYLLKEIDSAYLVREIRSLRRPSAAI
ncbi:MAG: response regulator transcription factor [Anaerolineae bacterium]|nr:response regulator transcription factor [Anaerolineae bacterium]MDW8067388.1 response regulator transcription factor [Anaerolineae bacterium]